MFNTLLPKHSTPGGVVDYVDMAVAWNTAVDVHISRSVAGTLRRTHEAHLRNYHNELKRKLGESIAMRPPPATPQEAAAPQGGLAPAAATSAPSQKVSQTLWGNLVGPVVANVFAVGSMGTGGSVAGSSGAGGSGAGGGGSRGKGVKKTCQGCQYFLKMTVPTNNTHKLGCEHLKKFKALPGAEQRRFAQRKSKEKMKGG